MTTTARIEIINEDKGRVKTYQVTDPEETYAVIELLRTFMGAEPALKKAMEEAATAAAMALPTLRDLADRIRNSATNAPHPGYHAEPAHVSDHDHTHPPRDTRPLPTKEDLDRISQEALARMDEEDTDEIEKYGLEPVESHPGPEFEDTAETYPEWQERVEPATPDNPGPGSETPKATER